MNKQTTGVIQVLISALLFGFIPVLVRWGENLGAYNLSFFRIIIATILLYSCTFFIKKFRIKKPEKEIKKLLLFGGIHGFIILGYFLSIHYLTITSAVLLLYSSSIWMIIFSYFILKEKITTRTWIALCIAILGVFLVLSPQNFFIKESLIGSIAGLLAGIGFGLVYVLSKTFKTYDKVSLTFWQNLIAIPFVTPLVFIDWPRFTTTDIWIVLLLGSLFTVVPFILVFKGLEKISGQTAGVIILLDILIPVIFAFLLFKEIPSTTTLLGGILIILGSILVAKKNTITRLRSIET